MLPSSDFAKRDAWSVYKNKKRSSGDAVVFLLPGCTYYANRLGQ